ncbi:hypothetical protein GCM10020260_00160 [Nesterenkonia halobia]|uniref:Uncharacterized protein n=1 Tax=Nesterenkonia halobia TaxID=37922 RepID=A0ABP6RA40_9MICC
MGLSYWRAIRVVLGGADAAALVCALGGIWVSGASWWRGAAMWQVWRGWADGGGDCGGPLGLRAVLLMRVAGCRRCRDWGWAGARGHLGQVLGEGAGEWPWSFEGKDATEEHPRQLSW